MEPSKAAHEDKSSDEEKVAQGQQLETGNDEFYDEFQPHEKRLMRKVDWRLLPILGALYAIALIDRVNVWNILFFKRR